MGRVEYRVVWQRKDGAEGSAAVESESQGREQVASYKGLTQFNARLERREVEPWRILAMDGELPAFPSPTLMHGGD